MFHPVWQPLFTCQLLTVAYFLVLLGGAVLVYRQLFAPAPASGRKEYREKVVAAD